MNIFYLDNDLEKCVQYHVDSHVVKMILESAQILCTALILHDIPAPYKVTHPKHPSVLWASYSLSNWLWLKSLAEELNKEYLYRWNKVISHKSWGIIASLESSTWRMIPDRGLTEIPQAMPDQYKVKGDPLRGYRNYYAYGKTALHKYTNREFPYWLEGLLQSREDRQ
jgi:hypothetical protein